MRSSAERAVLGVRPEHIDLLPPGEGVAARINYCEYFGSHWVADIESPLGNLKAMAPKDVRPAPGEAVGLRLHTERIVLFDSRTELLMPSDSTLQHRSGMRHG
jgi:ABC-type sugar transport system ATPase subunit